MVRTGGELTAHEWAFLRYHVWQDELEAADQAQARDEEQAALLYLIQYQPDDARRVLRHEPLGPPKETAPADVMSTLLSDPYFSITPPTVERAARMDGAQVRR